MLEIQFEKMGHQCDIQYLDDIDNKISLGNLKTNLNKYNLITKKVFKNKYLLWGLKKTVFENRRFIKKKSISKQIQLYITFL